MENLVLTTLTKGEFETLVIDCVRACLKHHPKGENVPDAIPDTRQIFNLDHFCDYTGLSKQTVYKKTSKGEIPHSKCGKRLFFEKVKVDEWLLENRVGSKSELDEKADNYRMTRRRARMRL